MRFIGQTWIGAPNIVRKQLGKLIRLQSQHCLPDLVVVFTVIGIKPAGTRLSRVLSDEATKLFGLTVLLFSYAHDSNQELTTSS